ncbi:MAG: sulfotransferase [Pseudomonadota bacterium]
MSVQTDLAKAKGLIKKGRVSEARERLFAVLGEFPGNRKAMEMLNSIGGSAQSPAEKRRIEALNQVIALEKADKLDAALARLNDVEEAFPGHPETYNLMGVVLGKAQRFEDAAEAFKRCLAFAPKQVAVMANLARALMNLGEVDAAARLFKEAIGTEPLNPGLRIQAALAFQSIGRASTAVSVLEAALKLMPDNAYLWTQLATIKDLKPGDPLLARFENMANASDASDAQVELLSFALGKAYDRFEEYEKAFDAFARGNAVGRKGLKYKPDDDQALFDRIKSAFAQPLPVLAGNSGIRPIFVVGMPRSGTTLLEQILGAHPDVEAAGEVAWFSRNVEPIFDKLSGPAATTFDSGRLQNLQDEYLAALAPLARGKANAVDKMPTNFRWIGLIAAAFPDAPILHIKRDPRATCWSIFRHNFSASGNKYSFDLSHIAAFHALYIDLMAHWHKNLPGRIFDLSYEALTENPDEEARAVLDHCGLAWDPQVLKFHEAERAVRTASTQQVREAVYTGSSDKWRGYAPYIGSAFDGLGVTERG